MKKLDALEGNIVVFARDPVFQRTGWCLEGPLMYEMVTMEFVSKLIDRPGVLGDRFLVKDGKLEALDD